MNLTEIVQKMLELDKWISPRRVQAYIACHGAWGPRPQLDEIRAHLREAGYIIQGSYDTLWKSVEERDAAKMRTIDAYDSYAL